jgi:hypothetical protein
MNLMQRQSRLGAVERLNLALLVDGEDVGVSRRMDIEPDDVAQLGAELRIIGKLEMAHSVRLEAMRAYKDSIVRFRPLDKFA